MATTIHKGAKQHLYITEWMDKFDLSDAKLAGRLDVAPETVWRWRNQQNRLNPGKIAAIASAISPELRPEDLWRPPERPSVDAYLRGRPLEEVEKWLRAVKAHDGEAA